MRDHRKGWRGAGAVRGALAALGLAALLVAPGPAGAVASATTTNVTLPLGFGVFVPCAAGGAGETVELFGSEHVVFHTTVDASGGLHVSSHFDAAGASGVGLATGTPYRGSGTTENAFNAGGPQPSFEFTFEDRFQLLGQGTEPNLALREREHVTVDADGTVTAVIADIRADCG